MMATLKLVEQEEGLSVRKLKAQDLQVLIDRKGRSFFKEITPEHARALELASNQFSLFIDGKLYGCGGVSEYWAGRAEAWAVLDPDCKNHFFTIHNVVKRFIELSPIRRIEASVECDFEPGHRWLCALGFKLDAERLEGFLPDGRAAALFSRVRKEGA